jgi:pyridoxine 5-phosphate synthase
MAAVEEIISIAVATRPDFVTLVPERREERTTEGGLDVVKHRRELVTTVKRFHDAGIPVSLFIEPERTQIETARELHADMIEIHTGEYANAQNARQRNDFLVKIQAGAKLAKSLNLGVNAGHGLNYVNTQPIAAMPEIDELSIGHAIISHAVFAGLDEAVRKMLTIVKGRH